MDVCDDRVVISNGGFSLLFLTLCIDNLLLPQFMHLCFAAQTILVFAQVQRVFWVQLFWFGFV